jgi:hypothetical protein
MFGSIIAVAAGMGLVASVALADHETTKKATVFGAQLGTAYDDCGIPGEGFSTDPPGLLLPACTPQRSDPVCNFIQGKGSGKILAKAAKNATTGIKDDIFVKASMAKLNAGCIGETLTLRATANATSDDCSGSPAAGGSCTVVTSVIGNFPIGSCVVDTKGKCKIVTTVNTFSGGTVIEAGNRLQLEIRDTRMRRGTITTFTPAVFVD